MNGTEEMTTAESEARNEMLRELTHALGWGDFAAPETPAEVWSVALGAVRRMREQNDRLRAELEQVGNDALNAARHNDRITWVTSR